MKKHTSSKISNQGLGRLTGPVTVVDVIGCTDVNSINYNATYTYTGTSGNSQVYQAYLNYSPTYNIDDGSCIARVFGCMNPTAFNYNPAANTQPAGECIFVYPGCMDPNSNNGYTRRVIAR